MGTEIRISPSLPRIDTTIAWTAAFWALISSHGLVPVGGGKHESRIISLDHNDIRFGGARYDPETGLYSRGPKMYHPALGRDLEREPARGAIEHPTNSRRRMHTRLLAVCHAC